MNVSFVLGSLSRSAGGLFDSCRRLAQELHQLPDTRVSVVGLRDAFTDVDEPKWAPLSVAACEPRGPRVLGWAPGCAAALTRNQPQLVHQHGIWTLGSLEVRRFARASRIPFVVSVHGMLNPWALGRSKWRKRAAWLAYQSDNLKHAGCIFVNSRAEARAVRDCNIAAPIAVVPNGVDTREPPTRAPAWRPVLGQERRVLLFLGRIHPIKGVFELLRAWAQFTRRYPDRARNWSLVITGWDDGGHEASLRQLANELGLTAPSLHFTGPLFGEERDAALAHASGFVLASHSEGMPMAALEALSAGTPLLLTDACNLAQVAESGAGLRLDASVDGICEGILGLAALTEEQHREMSARAARLAGETFAWPRIAEDTRRVYAWLLGNGPRPTELLF